MPTSETAVVHHTASERSQAWAVHVFTTLGVIVGMLGLRSVLLDQPGSAIIWLLATLAIDGIDGPVARALVVKERVPRIDGFVLDLIIDYVTCVIVPAAFMYQFDLLPRGAIGLLLIGLAVFTSAIWFSRVDMETEEHWFRGFPAAWNMVAPILFLLHTRPAIGAVVTLLLSIASLTNMPFPHVLRSRFMRPVTVAVTLILVAAIAAGAAELPDRPWILRPFLLGGSLYFVVLSAVQSVRTHRLKRVAADS